MTVWGDDGTLRSVQLLVLLLGVTASASASVLKIYLYNDENSDPNDKLTTRLEAREGFWRDAASLVLAPDLLNGEIGDDHPGAGKGDDEEDTISLVLAPDKIDGDLFYLNKFPLTHFSSQPSQVAPNLLHGELGDDD